jgi:hypothetical protein
MSESRPLTPLKLSVNADIPVPQPSANKRHWRGLPNRRP